MSLIAPIHGLAESNRLAVIACHFNFAEFVRPRQNLMNFVRYMSSLNVPVYGVEAYLIGSTPFTIPLKGWSQVPVGLEGILWQKEALLNLAETQVPAQYDQIAWIDADVDFSNHSWPQMTAFALEQVPVVHMFSQCHWTLRDGTVERSRPSCIRQRLDHRWVGHPGMAWAARRELWRDLRGLYDHAVVGTGDTALACAFLDAPMPCGNVKNNLGLGIPETAQYYEQWKRSVSDWTKRNVGYLPVEITHSWHGDWDQRAYYARTNFMREFDAERHVCKLPNGTMAWTNDTPQHLRENVRDYFYSRKEDG